MGVNTWFRKFHENIYINQSIVDKIQFRYKAITRRINLEYWDSDSELKHSFYSGSYGRGTEVKTSDIDIVVELPYSVKLRFDKRNGNKQSQLLTEVKEKLQKTYSTSDVSSDGQVIVINFSDGIKFEVVPAFHFKDEMYWYADTNNGGSWKLMSPKEEMSSFNDRNTEHNYTMKKFCRMIRLWKECNNIDISGELIDTMVYSFYKSASYVDNSPYLYFDFISRDFFKYIKENAHADWRVFGSYRSIKVKYPYTFEGQAKTAYNNALSAIKYGEEYPYSAKEKWREIYGSKFGY